MRKLPVDAAFRRQTQMYQVQPEDLASLAKLDFLHAAERQAEDWLRGSLHAITFNLSYQRSSADICVYRRPPSFSGATARDV